MQFVPIFTLREGVVVAAGVLAAILFLWFLARLSHRPYIVRDQSEAERVVAIQLGRIADSIDRLARSLESRTSIEEVSAAAQADEKPHGMSLSMFGR
jgi:hypothetical protein